MADLVTGVQVLTSIATGLLDPEVERALRQLHQEPTTGLSALRTTLLAAGEAAPSAPATVPILAAWAAGSDIDAATRHGVILLLAHLALAMAHSSDGGRSVSPATGDVAIRLRTAFLDAYPVLRIAAAHDLPRLSGFVGTMKLLAERPWFHTYHSMLAFIDMDG